MQAPLRDQEGPKKSKDHYSGARTYIQMQNNQVFSRRERQRCDALGSKCIEQGIEDFKLTDVATL